MDKENSSKELLKYIFKAAKKEEIANRVNQYLDKWQASFAYETANYLVNGLESTYLPAEIKQLFLLSFDAAGKKSPWRIYIALRLAVNEGDFLNALKLFEELYSILPELQPALRLSRCRILVREKSWQEAIIELRQALFSYPAYPFFVKAEKLVCKMMASKEWMPKRKFKIALFGSHTTEFLASVLVVCAFREEIELEVYQGMYGGYCQEILNPQSGIYSFIPDIVVLLPSERELPEGLIVDGEIIKQYSDNLIRLWSVVKERQHCHVIQAGLSMPAYSVSASLAENLPTGRSRAVQEINERLARCCGDGVSFFDMNRVVAQVGRAFFSPEEWYMAKQYPASCAVPFLADCLIAHVKAVYGLSSKVLVLDLDNTLWGGVIGEDGLGGIRLGYPSPEGEGYVDLQKLLKDLKQRGVLLAVCSKNNEDDAKMPFERHDAMVLKLDDFVAFKANWKDKVANIVEIAELLSLGLDSFVFLDDSPLERAWVREKLPMVKVPECGKTPWEMTEALRRGMYFDAVALTQEDRHRHESYKANIERQEFKNSAGSLENFLSGLSMIGECGFVDDRTLARVTQLVNKTNQFNLTAKRYSEEQIKKMVQSEKWWCRWYRLRDRFGDHGLIGVILVEKRAKEWLVDTWLMSCRVLGRRMEEFMCRDLLMAAKNAGILSVQGIYCPTAKNVLVKGLYEQLGFFAQGQGETYSFNMETGIIPKCHFIQKLVDEINDLK